MKLIYNGKRLVDGKDCGYDINTDFRQAGLTLGQCVEFGFIVAEIFHAKRNPGEWHDFSREESLFPGVRTKSDAIADLTKRLDKLVAASRSALPHLHHYYKLYPCEAVSLDIGSFVSAIANAEPKP